MVLPFVMSVWVVATITVIPWAWNAFDPVQHIALIGGAIVVAPFLVWRWRKSSSFVLNWGHLLPLIPLIVLVIQAVVGAEQDWRIENGLAWWTALLLAALVPVLISSQERILLMRVWIGIGVLESAVVLLQATGVDPLFLFVGHFDGIWRVYGTLGNPNLVAALLVPLTLLATDEVFIPHSKLRTGVVALMMVAIVVTGSRFAVVVLAGLMLWRYAHLAKPGAKMRWVFWGGAAASILVVFMIGYGMDKSMHSPLGRLFFWDVALRLTLDNPWPGHGWGSFGAVYPSGLELMGEGRQIPEALPLHAHNDWLEFGTEFGMAGLLLCIGVVTTLISRTRRDASPLLLALWSAVLLAGWSAPLHEAPTALLFWMMFGLLAADGGTVRLKRGMVSLLLVGISLLCLLGIEPAWSRLQGHILASSDEVSVQSTPPKAERWKQAFTLAPMDGYFAAKAAFADARNGDLVEALEWSRLAKDVCADFALWELQAWLLASLGCYDDSLKLLNRIWLHFPGLESASRLRSAVVASADKDQVIRNNIKDGLCNALP